MGMIVHLAQMGLKMDVVPILSFCVSVDFFLFNSLNDHNNSVNTTLWVYIVVVEFAICFFLAMFHVS